jgi:methylenetetrahydrofolate dehydrogenase (NADP+)/methenyltetrahydrofolate cyclohydrolase
MNEATTALVEVLTAQGARPTLVIVRVGEREDAVAYARGATRRCEQVGVVVRELILPDDCSQAELVAAIQQLNSDDTAHGVLLLRPLPTHIDDDTARNTLAPHKDIDGITDASVVGVFTGEDRGFNPCTPQACLEILDHYGIEIAGRRVVVIGRSLVVGKPVAHMLLARNATVTIAHSRTADLPSVVREADIVVACVGRAGMVGIEHLSPGQIVIDVGINVLTDGSLAGDVDFASAQEIVSAITPVPGGVGTVTTSVLVKHVAQAAKKTQARIIKA